MGALGPADSAEPPQRKQLPRFRLRSRTQRRRATTACAWAVGRGYAGQRAALRAHPKLNSSASAGAVRLLTASGQGLAARAGGRKASDLLGMRAVMRCRRRAPAVSGVSSDLEGSGTGVLGERCVSSWKAACAVKELHTSLVPAYLETVGMLPRWTACGSHACHACVRRSGNGHLLKIH